MVGRGGVRDGQEYTSGRSTWRAALRRAAQALSPRRSGDRRGGWSAGVPVIAFAAGLLFTTSATTADGTVLREDRRPRLTELIEDRQERIGVATTAAAELQQRVDALTTGLAGSDGEVLAQQARAERYRAGAGFTALHGPGLTVSLDDAHRLDDGTWPEGAANDDLIVHEADVQAVVNALWAGGAEAMMIMGARVISTSAVICVGNTLLLHGRTYSPPFVITGIGDPAAMRAALEHSVGVRLFREAVTAYGLGYAETVEEDVTVPAYDGVGALAFAETPGQP
jgi:uncharacterized protein YlxW (UPF0749 family)